MTRERLKQLFPNASEDVLALSCSVQDAKPQPNKAPALGAAVQGKEESLRRAVVRFTLHRVRLLDPDNAAGSCKDLLDGLRHAEIITGDEWYRLKLEVEQVRVAKFSQEKTEVEVWA